MSGFLEGKAVAITGAGSGIGRAIAKACAAEGAQVVVNDLGVDLTGSGATDSVAEGLAAEILADGGAAAADHSDISTMEGGARVVATAVESFGRIDGVVCAAGILRERMLFNMSETEWDGVVDTHLKGTFTVFRAASAVMRKSGGGRLVGITSGAFAGSVSQANYSAAKGGVVSLVRSAALGLHKYGVTSNAIAPIARTRMSAEIPFDLAEIGDPEDIAPMVCFLLSDHASEVTGQVYTVTGPKIALWAQPREIRSAYADERWTPEDIARRFDTSIGQDRLPMLDRLEEMARGAAEAKTRISSN